MPGHGPIVVLVHTRRVSCEDIDLLASRHLVTMTAAFLNISHMALHHV